MSRNHFDRNIFERSLFAESVKRGKQKSLSRKIFSRVQTYKQVRGKYRSLLHKGGKHESANLKRKLGMARRLRRSGTPGPVGHPDVTQKWSPKASFLSVLAPQSTL